MPLAFDCSTHRSQGSDKNTSSRASKLHLIWLLFLLLATPDLVAHDFWIQPVDFRNRAGSVVALQLFVGDHFHQGTPFTRDPSHIRRFIAVGPTGQIPMSSLPGRLSGLAYRRQSDLGSAARKPAAYLQPKKPGLYVIGYESNPTRAALETERFASYLAAEGLEKPLYPPDRKAQSKKHIIELYSRCAKSLVAVGDIEAGLGDVQLGFTLELMAEKNPYALSPEDGLSVRIFFEGKALPGALISALSQNDPGRKVSARSDQDGRVIFSLSGGGIWMVRAIHMVPADSSTSADWQSYWASLTFELSNPTATTGGRE